MGFRRQIRFVIAAAIAFVTLPGAIAANEAAVAVIIGNANYAGDRIPNVDYAHRDADVFKRFPCNVQGYHKGNIIGLRDATQAQVTGAFGN